METTFTSSFLLKNLFTDHNTFADNLSSLSRKWMYSPSANSIP